MRKVYLTVDLGFGDAGKGALVDFLTRSETAHTVVRYNGGAQAGHRVVDCVTGQDHVFAQFGSGTLAGAGTHLSRFMLVEPLAMQAEAQHLVALGVADPWARTTIAAEALVTTPFHRASNRLKELARGAQRHGSCGLGIGETVADALVAGNQVLRMGDLHQRDLLYAKLARLRQSNLAKLAVLRPHLPANEQVARELDLLLDPDWADWLLGAYQAFTQQAQIVPDSYLSTLLQRPGTVVFEGAQGVLLDEWLGFHPHTTWSTTTLANADCLLAAAGYAGPVTRIGLTRGYMTRHGAGPLVTEDPALTAALPDAANGFGEWQQGFRVGWLDLVLLRYAVQAVGRLDLLAVSCLDRLAGLAQLQLCRRYSYRGQSLTELTPAPTPRNLTYQAQLTAQLACCQPTYETVADVPTLLELTARTLGLPVGITSWGPSADAKRWLEGAAAKPCAATGPTSR